MYTDEMKESKIRNFFEKHGFENERYAASESSRDNASERLWNYLEDIRLEAVKRLNEFLPDGYRAMSHDVGSAHNGCRIVIMDNAKNVVFSYWGEKIPEEIIEALKKAELYI